MTRRIESPEDLTRLRDKAQAEIDLRSGPRDMTATVHMGTCGIAAGARDVLAALAAELRRASASTVLLKQSGCAGLCAEEPMLTLTDREGQSFRYGKLDRARVSRIVREHVTAGRPVLEFVINR